MNVPELPIIEFVDPDDSTAAAEIRRACETIGFFYVSGHGVPAQVIEEALATSQAFFALPTAEKEAIAVTRRNYRGYIPMAAFSANAGDRMRHDHTWHIGHALSFGDKVTLRFEFRSNK